MALMKDGPAITPNADKFKWVPGQKYVCTSAASPGYRIGDVVVCYTNDKGWKVVKGRDGFEDICHMLVSTFRKA
jgi:hypothetical protein